MLGAEDPMSRDTGQHRLRAFEVTEHWVAPDDPVTAPRLVAGVVALDGPWEIQVDQFVGRRDRERSQQDLVEERVDRGIRADAERERKDRDPVDEGRRAEGAERILRSRIDGEVRVGWRREPLVGHPCTARRFGAAR